MHLFVGEPIENRGNGLEGLQFLAGNPVALRFLDEKPELGADFFGVGAEELLLPLALNEIVGGRTGGNRPGCPQDTGNGAS